MIFRLTDDLYVPQGEAARRAHAERIGRDGHALLAAVFSPDAPGWLREIPAVILLGRVWLQNFQVVPVDDETSTQNHADHTKPQTTGVVANLLGGHSTLPPDDRLAV